MPRLRRSAWCRWYQYLARSQPQPDWTFMNYGHADGEELALDPEREPDRHAIQLYERVVRNVELEGRDVLEVGSGRGGGAAWLAERHRPARLVGVDLVAANVELCRRLHVVPGLEFRQGDAEALPLGDATVDVVVNVESSHCYPSRARFYAEASRVLRPGGRFLHADLFDRDECEEIRSALTASGFSIREESDITEAACRAMSLDDEWKRALLARWIPRWLRGLFGQFAGLEGSRVHDALRAGELVYLAFDLEVTS